jgi:[protein-PII] uridylyltransferase
VIGDVTDLDGWLASLLGDERDVSLVAVGSRGRGDAATHSDFDLVLVHRGRADVGDVAERLWYPIWDKGISLDHSVPTVDEALEVSDGDLKAMLGLLEVRFIAGDRPLAEDLATRARASWRTNNRRWLRVLHEAVVERHAKFGEVAFLLEPELKEGRGGLRDVHALRAARLSSPVLSGRLGGLDEPYERLVAVRTALHTRAGRALDMLVLQEQDGVD